MRELVQDFDREIAATYSYFNPAFYPDIDFFGTKLVDALTLPQEHNLQLVLV